MGNVVVDRTMECPQTYDARRIVVLEDVGGGDSSDDRGASAGGQNDSPAGGGSGAAAASEDILPDTGGASPIAIGAGVLLIFCGLRPDASSGSPAINESRRVLPPSARRLPLIEVFS